ncbi:MAG: aminopeptidase N, partial [Chitinophagaceae bacterium]
MKNLTRHEATTRARALTVESYDVHLVLGEDEAFESTTTVRFRSTAAETFLELDGELLELTGATAGPQQGNRIPLSGLGGEHEVTVRARCSTTRTGEGLHRFVDPADGLVYLWGQSFLDDAQRVFACFDQPDLKAVVRLTVDAPAGWTVVGNARGHREGDRWTFAPTERISTYLFTVAAGPWHST